MSPIFFFSLVMHYSFIDLPNWMCTLCYFKNKSSQPVQRKKRKEDGYISTLTENLCISLDFEWASVE